MVMLWAGMIFYLSSISPSKALRLLPRIPHLDKWLHFTAYCMGGYWFGRALAVTFAWKKRWVILVGVVILSLYGVSDEYHQTFVEGRTGGDPGDVVADILGSLTGLVLSSFPVIYARKSDFTPTA